MKIADKFRCPMCSHRFGRHGERGCEVVMMLNAGACRCTMTAAQLWGTSTGAGSGRGTPAAEGEDE